MNAENKKGRDKRRKEAEVPENIFLVKEVFLKGKTGLIVDSSMMTDTFRMFIEKAWGGRLVAAEFIDDTLLQQIKDNNVDFAIVHNYVLEDKEALLRLMQSGVPLIFAVRYLFPDGQSEKYQAMHDQLAAAGAHLVYSTFRLQDGMSKLFELFSNKKNTQLLD